MSDDAAPLRRMVALAMAPPRPSAWDSPTRAMLQSAAAAYLLLDRGSPGAAFLDGGLERLTRELTRSSTRRTVTDQEGLRGQVIWSATIAARADRGDGGPAYVYREVRHRYDTPENQLLRHVVDQLAEGLRQLPPPLRAGLCYAPVGGGLEQTAAAARLERVEGALLRAGAGLRAVTPAARIGPEHLLRAETARNEAYVAASRLHRQHAQLLDPRSWRAALARIGRRVLVLPAAAGPESEPWIELAAIALRGA